jgi:hypothetical protein
MKERKDNHKDHMKDLYTQHTQQMKDLYTQHTQNMLKEKAEHDVQKKDLKSKIESAKKEGEEIRKSFELKIQQEKDNGLSKVTAIKTKPIKLSLGYTIVHIENKDFQLSSLGENTNETIDENNHN